MKFNSLLLVPGLLISIGCASSNGPSLDPNRTDCTVTKSSCPDLLGCGTNCLSAVTE
jgi:hypothetical protein